MRRGPGLVRRDTEVGFIPAGRGAFALRASTLVLVASSLENRIVLVVDDDELLRSLYRVVLAHAGAAVVDTGSGLEAVRLARSSGPDIVVLDIDMPMLDGWEVAALLHGDPATAAIPIVFVTGRSAVEARPQAAAAGASACITKPIDPQYLVDQLDVILSDGARPALAS